MNQLDGDIELDGDFAIVRVRPADGPNRKTEFTYLETPRGLCASGSATATASIT